jgi:hypothetical protein
VLYANPPVSGFSVAGQALINIQHRPSASLE